MNPSGASACPTAKPSGPAAQLPGRLRATRQGAAVEAALSRAGGFRSAQELHAEMRAQGDNIGLSTVYRHLTGLADSGTVDAVRTADGEAAYRLCASEDHHHHVVCRSCGSSVEVEGPEVEAWAAKVAAQAGYIEVSHTVEVFGTCLCCASNNRSRRR